MVAPIIKVGISQNINCNNMVGFLKSDHIIILNSIAGSLHNISMLARAPALSCRCSMPIKTGMSP